MFSFPLYERLKANMPEFEQTTVFQAGRWRVSARREGDEAAARPLRSEYVSGSYFTTFGIGAFGGRMFTEDDDKASAPIPPPKTTWARISPAPKTTCRWSGWSW